MTNLNIGIIGAGRSGLCAAKYGLEQGFRVTVYEKNEALGGTWRYTDDMGKNKYGLDIHTAMYKGLRTRIPIQLMAYSDFSFPNETKSYPLYTEVLKYLESYADHFDLKRHMKFNHNVIRVVLIENEKWEIIVKDLANNTIETRFFDAIFIANGHFSVPNIPEISSASKFNGKMFHSHDFRNAERYQGERILVIGGKDSGTDVVNMCSSKAERITWSQHKKPNESMEALEKRKKLLPPNVTLRWDVKHFTLTGAEFTDGSHETFSIVIYATGYHFKYPFLSSDCGIYVDNEFVQPLYKHIINAEHPTMAFLGITYIHDHDLQVKFAMKFISGAKKLPTKHEMLNDIQTQHQILSNKDVHKNRLHALHSPELSRDFLKQLSVSADIEQYPDVLHSIFEDNDMTFRRNSKEFRKYNYIIADNNTTFIKVKCEE